MTRRMLRYEIPISQAPWFVTMPAGQVLDYAVDCRHPLAETVDLWVLLDGADTIQTRRAFQVVGTGEAVPTDATYRGTALSPEVRLGGGAAGARPRGALVWHLFELPVAVQAPPPPVEAPEDVPDPPYDFDAPVLRVAPPEEGPPGVRRRDPGAYDLGYANALDAVSAALGRAVGYRPPR